MSDAMDRLSKLIAQADRASTPAEAKAFLQKAQAMSAQINVELAVARAHAADKEKREEPVADHKVQVNDWSAKPIHRDAMMDLWLAVADANEIRCTVGGGNFLAFAYGFPSDIELAEKLFAVLSLRMVSEADAAIKRGDQKWVIDEAKREIGIDGRVYRRLFYEGFTKRVSGRLWQSRQDAIKASDEATGGSAEVALRDKSEEVDAFYQEKIKHLSLRGSYKGLDNSDASVGDAKRHGRQAGDRADLGLHDKDVSGSRTAAIGS